MDVKLSAILGRSSQRLQGFCDSPFRWLQIANSGCCVVFWVAVNFCLASKHAASPPDTLWPRGIC
jgi:hypothetical protein